MQKMCKGEGHLSEECVTGGGIQKKYVRGVIKKSKEAGRSERTEKYKTGKEVATFFLSTPLTVLVYLFIHSS